jgi:hypothetical protein
MIVDLPEPLSPTNAIYYPRLIFRERLLRTIVLDVGYLKVTFLNSISPEIGSFYPIDSSTKGL